jgi:cytochrome b561
VYTHPMLKNTDTSYGSLSKLFHWVVALLIIGLLIVGNIMTDMDKGELRYTVYGLHKATGMLVLALVIARICWRVINVQPKHDIARWQKIVSHIVHYALYAFMILMPLSGWLLSSAGGHPIRFYGLFTVPPLVVPDHDFAEIMEDAHGAIGWIIVALLAAHIGAALLHHFYYKDNILRRMLPHTKG